MNYIVYDIEATCWMGRPPGMIQEVIEIGAYKVNDYGEVTGKFERFVRPEAHPVLSSFCKHLTGISQVDINRADSFPRVIDDFMDWIDLDEDYSLCSWGDFDWRILANNSEMHRIDPDWTAPHTNLKNQYKRIRKLPKPFGMKKAVEKEGFEFEGDHHRGIDDAYNLTKVFLKLREAWII